MENASKALIMAGAILIAMIIVSLSIFTFSKMGEKVKEKTDMTEEEIKMFNSKITPYLGKQSGTQVNVLIQYVISNNISVVQSGDKSKAIKITFPGNTGTGNGIYVKTSSSPMEVKYGSGEKRVETGSSHKYEVKATYNTDGLITEIVVTQLP